MTPDLENKVPRLLADGQVYIKWCTPEVVVGVVRGDGGVYDVRLDRGRWSCPCAARATCSHLRAVWLVTVPTEGKSMP